MPFVVLLLHHPLPIFRREQRQDGRHLVVPHAVPVRIAWREPRVHVAPVPLAGHRGMTYAESGRRACASFEERLVVLARGLELVRAHDGCARVITIAVAPGRRRCTCVTDQPCAVRAPLLFDADGTVAAKIAGIAPERAILVEILGREQVDGKRRHARGGVAVAGRAHEGSRCIARRRTTWRPERPLHRCADDLVLPQIGCERRASAYALEARIGHLLRPRRRAERRERDDRAHVPQGGLTHFPSYQGSRDFGSRGQHR